MQQRSDNFSYMIFHCNYRMRYWYVVMRFIQPLQ